MYPVDDLLWHGQGCPLLLIQMASAAQHLENVLPLNQCTNICADRRITEFL